jgi:hypothetical protein
MNSAKRALITLAVFGTLATGAIAMPMVAAAAPTTTCPAYGEWTSSGASDKNPNEGYANMTPAFLADYYGGQNTGARQQDIRNHYTTSGGHC